MMTNKGLHSVIRAKTIQQVKQLEVTIAERKQELREAANMGDFSENSEFDSAKADLAILLEEQRDIKELLDMPTLTSRNTNIIEPGCIVEIEIYGPNKQPLFLHGSTANNNLKKLNFTSNNERYDSKKSESNMTNSGFEFIKDKEPDFHGILLFGGSTPRHTCLTDHIFLENTPIGLGINGKPAGIYEIEGPSGFLLVNVRKVKEDEKEIQTGNSFKK